MTNIPQALDRLESARRTFPLDYRYRKAVAEFYSKRRWAGSGDGAITALRQALADDPNSADLHRNLASYLWEAGRYAESNDEILAFHRIAPKEPIVLVVNVNPESR